MGKSGQILDATGFGTTCFRCGECCIRYQPMLSQDEAQKLAAESGIELNEWVNRYTDSRWRAFDEFLLGQNDGVCVFLEWTNEGKGTRCLIHNFKPSACREWAVDFNKRECREGLFKSWGLTFNSSGQPEGEVVPKNWTGC